MLEIQEKWENLLEQEEQLRPWEDLASYVKHTFKKDNLRPSRGSRALEVECPNNLKLKQEEKKIKIKEVIDKYSKGRAAFSSKVLIARTFSSNVNLSSEEWYSIQHCWSFYRWRRGY